MLTKTALTENGKLLNVLVVRFGKGTNTQRIKMIDLIHPMMLTMMPRRAGELNVELEWRPAAQQPLTLLPPPKPPSSRGSDTDDDSQRSEEATNRGKEESLEHHYNNYYNTSNSGSDNGFCARDYFADNCSYDEGVCCCTSLPIPPTRRNPKRPREIRLTHCLQAPGTRAQ